MPHCPSPAHAESVGFGARSVDVAAVPRRITLSWDLLPDLLPNVDQASIIFLRQVLFYSDKKANRDVTAS